MVWWPVAWPALAQAKPLAKAFLFWGLLLDALGSFLCAVAGDLLSKFHDGAVVYDAINGGSGGHGVFEDLLPLGENQVGCDDDAAAFVTFGQQGEKHFHLVAGLLDIADVVENDDFVGVEVAQLVFKQQVALGAQEFVNKAVGRSK